MTVKKGQNLELEITDWAFGGRGLAKQDGMAVFVDGAIPQDRVMARVFRKKKNYAEARLVSIIEPSPFRVTPPCKYSSQGAEIRCGGCKCQFLAYPQQLEYKRQQVADTLAHIGNLDGVQVHPTIPSEKIYGYRNKMEFTFSDWRWLLQDELGEEGVDRSFALGLHVPGTFYKVLDMDACLIQPDYGNRILQEARRYIRQSGVPIYGLRSHEGYWRFLMLRHSVADDQWMVNIVTASEDLTIIQPLAQHLIKTCPEISTITNNITARKSSVAIGESEILLHGSGTISDKIGPYKFSISANSFFQTNTRGATRLYEIVKQYADLNGDEILADLYSGTGAIASFLSDSARTVIGIEINAGAITDANNNCQRNHVTNCKFLQGDIKGVLSQLDTPPDVIIIDPPRSGMHPDVVKQVLALAPPRIVYVSCNPATFARDIGMMKDVYTLTEVQPVDMFPHTHHIEAVGRLEKTKKIKVRDFPPINIPEL
jgi:23S rRNA (uracil1939-C5)-methyltransferase